MALSLFTLAPAQGRIWIVDAANGPGTDFTDLPPAVGAAAPGDILSVRAGGYTGFRVSKALTILGGPNVAIANGGPSYMGLDVANLPPGSTFVMHGVSIRLLAIGTPVNITGSAGRVVLASVDCWGMTIDGSSEVRLVDCDLSRVLVRSSRVSFDRCVMNGQPAPFLQAYPALQADQSSVVLSRCQVTGIDERASFSAQGTAIQSSSSSIVLTGDGTGRVAAGMGSQSRSAIEGSGSLILDPHVPVIPFGSAPPVAAAIAVTTRPIPSLRADGAPPGEALTAELFSVQGDLYGLAVGFPAPPQASPALHGSFWMGPALLAWIGTFSGSDRVVHQVPLPSTPILIGMTVGWQGVAGNGTTGFALSNPGSSVIRM